MLCPNCHQPVAEGAIPPAEARRTERDGDRLIWTTHCGCGRWTSRGVYTRAADGMLDPDVTFYRPPFDGDALHGPEERWSL